MPQVTFGLTLLSVLLATQAPSLDQALARAGQYVSGFHDSYPLILADESYLVRTRVVFDSLDAYPDIKAHPERYYDVPRVTVDVVYKPNPQMKVRMPVEVKESFDSRAEVVTCTATYSNFRRPDVASNQAP